MVYIACKGNHSKIFDRFEQARKAQQIAANHRNGFAENVIDI